MPNLQSRSTLRKPANGAARVRANGGRKPAKPSTPYPGYMTDEWHEYGMAVLRSQTKAQFRADLVRYGITDKQGKYTAPYRNA